MNRSEQDFIGDPLRGLVEQLKDAHGDLPDEQIRDVAKHSLDPFSPRQGFETSSPFLPGDTLSATYRERPNGYRGTPRGGETVEDVRSERIAKAEQGLAEMQEVLDQAKRAVDAADRAERAAHEAAEHARSLAKIAMVVAAAVTAIALIRVSFRRRQ